MRDTRARSSSGFLARALGACRADRITGSLYLAGHPGGVVHLREGAVVAVDSPGMPGTDALLPRSGRISEPDWSAVLRAGGVPHGIGGTELRLVTTMAAQDGAFTIVAGAIDEYAVDPDPLDVPVPVSPGIELDRLPAETARRLDALASLPTPVSPHPERLAAVVADPKPVLPRRDPGASGAGDGLPRPSGWQVLPGPPRHPRRHPQTP